MPSSIAIVKTDETNIISADPGKMNLFVGLDDILRGKDEIGALFVFDPSVASALATAGSPIIIDASPPPTSVGDVMAITGALAGGFVDPRVALISQTVRQNGIVTADTGADLDELILVDLITAAANVTVSLPTPVPDREIWVKIDSDVGAFKVIIAPTGGALVDGFAAGDGGILELVTNRQWIKLRGHQDNTNWLVVG